MARRPRQPQQPQINWGNPLTRNPAFLAVGTSPRELITGTQMVPSGTTPPVSLGTPNGLAQKFTSGAETVSYLSLGALSNASTVDIAGGPCTFVAVFYANSNTGVALAERNDANAVGTGWEFGYVGGTPNLGLVREDKGATNVRKNITNTVSTTGLNVMVATHDGGLLASGMNIYLNGVLGTVAGTTDGSSGFNTDASNSLYIGRNSFQTNKSHDGSILLVGAFRRQWTQPEVMAFMANPWQLFKGQPNRLAVSLPGNNNSASPGVGTLTLTGFAPSITQPQTAGPGVGSLTLAGFSPTVAQPQTAAPGVGSLALAGFAPTVAQSVNQQAAPGVGSLTLSGFAPTVSQPQTAAPGVAALTLTGYAPTVGLGQNVQPGAAALALTGFAPSVAQSANQAVSPGVGALTLAGFAPTTAQSNNQAAGPGAGSLTLSGFAPTVVQQSQSPNVQPGAGSLVLTGYAPTVVVSGGRDQPGFDVDLKGRRKLREATVKPMLVRAMERRLQNVKPAKERAAARAKAIEFEAAALVLDGATQRDIAPLLQQWEAQRPYIPPKLADIPTLDVFLSQIGFRIEQAQAQKAALDAVATARRQDEDALLALMLA
jgi:Concanavalin A-like lectin/glucanases superfamily